MTEKEFIATLKRLLEIRPNSEWVVLTKKEILKEELIEEGRSSPSFFFFFKPVSVGLILIVLISLLGILTLAQKSLPGDLVYPIKEITEKIQTAFVSEKEKPEVSLQLVNKRVEELNRVVDNNRIRNLPSAIKKTQTSISEAVQNLAKTESTNLDHPQRQKVVSNLKEIEKKLNKITSLGIVMEGKEIEEFEQISNKIYKKEVERIIKVLEDQSSIGGLDKEKEKILQQIKEMADQGRYSEALELYLINQ